MPEGTKVAKTVQLSREYVTPAGKRFSAVRLREPRFSDYLDLGEPREIQPAGRGGGMMVLTYYDVAKQYIDRLVKEPEVGDLVDLGLHDTKAVMEAVMDFFTKPATSGGEETNSSSSSDGPPPKSSD